MWKYRVLSGSRKKMYQSSCLIWPETFLCVWGCSSILSVSERGCQCERRKQTCKRVAKHYTIGLHKNPPSLDHNCPFLSVFCFCFVPPHLWWYLSQWRIQKPALVWKKSHLQSFTLTKKLYFNITITSDNSIYLPCSFCATNEQRYTRFYCSG